MAGLALLPWEKWIARLLHPIAVAIVRRRHTVRREQSLTRSKGWPETEGTVQQIVWDSSFPREEIRYYYSTPEGYESGSFWHWFDRSDAREMKAGDKVILRYSPNNHAQSVFLKYR
jgi:hypothetical protein